MKRRRFSREQWLEWFAEHAASDLSIAEFRVQKGISENSFYFWRRKLSCDVQSERRSSPFIPVKVVDQSTVNIALPCGARIEVPSVDSALRPALKVLLELDGPS